MVILPVDSQNLDYIVRLHLEAALEPFREIADELSAD